MDPIRKIPKKFTKKFGNKVINRQYFCRKTELHCIKMGDGGSAENTPEYIYPICLPEPKIH